VYLYSPLHLVEVDLNRRTLLTHVVLDHVVACLHVDPAALMSSRQKVHCTLQEPELPNDVDDVQFSMQLLHALAFDTLVVRRLVPDLAAPPHPFVEILLQLW